jgi:hypothetical protein
MTPTPRTPKLQVELIPLKNSKLKLGCLATSSILFSGSHRSVSIVFFFHNRAVSLLRSRRPTPGGGGGRGVALPQGSPAAALHRHSATPGQPRGGPTPVALRLGQPQQRPCVGLDPPPRWPCRAPLPLCPLASSDGTPPARPFLAAAPRLPPFRRP